MNIIHPDFTYFFVDSNKNIVYHIISDVNIEKNKGNCVKGRFNIFLSRFLFHIFYNIKYHKAYCKYFHITS